MNEDLERVLEEKKKAMEENGRNWEERKKDWVSRIDSLYDMIESWLTPLVEKKYITITRGQLSVFEELLGSYEAPTMSVKFFSGEIIKLVPKGLHVVGGNGRVDMKIGLREIMIVGQDKEQGWFFAERINRGQPKAFDFNQETFENLLHEFVEAE